MVVIQHIVFDIGNVLVRFDPVQHFFAYFKEEEKTKQLCAKVFAHEAWEKYDQGVYVMEDLKKLYRKEYSSEWEDISYILEHWLQLMTFMPETLSYAKQLKQRGYHTYLLSNISKDSADYLKKTMPFFDEIKDGVLSYEVQVNKPNKKIYEHLLQTYALRPEETIFLDDKYANVKKAKQLGMHAFVFTTITHAIEDVERTIRSMEAC